MALDAKVKVKVKVVRGQLEAQVSKCSTSERIIGDKDSEIQRLMNELSSSQQSLALSHEVRQQLEERLPALATDNQESAKLLPLVRNLGDMLVLSRVRIKVLFLHHQAMTQFKVRSWKLFRH